MTDRFSPIGNAFRGVVETQPEDAYEEQATSVYPEQTYHPRPKLLVALVVFPAVRVKFSLLYRLVSSNKLVQTHLSSPKQ